LRSEIRIAALPWPIIQPEKAATAMTAHSTATAPILNRIVLLIADLAVAALQPNGAAARHLRDQTPFGRCRFRFVRAGPARNSRSGRAY
jgi:hypothetical protein